MVITIDRSIVTIGVFLWWVKLYMPLDESVLVIGCGMVLYILFGTLTSAGVVC